jgi:S1-C subfamily serine protease
LIPSTRAGRLLAGLAISVVVVLLHGLAVRQRGAPEPSRSSKVEPPPVAPALRPDLEKTPLSYQSDYWRQLGERVKPKIVLVGSRSIPALVVAPGLAVSAPRVAVEPADASIKLLGGGPESALALLRIEPSTEAPVFVPSDPASLHAGLLVAAVSVTAEGRLLVAPGYLASAPNAPEEGSSLTEADSLTVSIAFPHPLAVAAIVDLDGNLVGAAFDVGGSLRLLSSETLVRVVERLGRHPFCYGIEVAAIDERVKKLLGVTGGVIVERVRETSFLAGPSIREGDVLLEWGGRGIASAEEFRRSYEAQAPGANVAFEVRRGRRRIRGSTVIPGPDCLPAGRSPVTLSKIGMTLGGAGEPETGWEVSTLASGGPAARGGIEVADRILRVDGLELRHGGLELLQGFERRPRALLILVRRDRRVRLLAVSPNDQ